MHDESRFLYWVADPWIWVSNFSMLCVQLSKLEVVSRLGLNMSLLTPDIPILLWFPTLFLLWSDVHIVLLLPPKLLHYKPITNVFDWFVLSVDELFIESCSLEFVNTCVTRYLFYCPMIPMAAGSRSLTPIDKVQTPSTMWVSFIGLFLGSTCLLESLIVSTCSSDS